MRSSSSPASGPLHDQLAEGRDVDQPGARWTAMVSPCGVAVVVGASPVAGPADAGVQLRWRAMDRRALCRLDRTARQHPERNRRPRRPGGGQPDSGRLLPVASATALAAASCENRPCEGPIVDVVYRLTARASRSPRRRARTSLMSRPRRGRRRHLPRPPSVAQPAGRDVARVSGRSRSASRPASSVSRAARRPRRSRARGPPWPPARHRRAPRTPCSWPATAPAA